MVRKRGTEKLGRGPSLETRRHGDKAKKGRTATKICLHLIVHKDTHVHTYMDKSIWKADFYLLIYCDVLLKISLEVPPISHYVCCLKPS